MRPCFNTRFKIPQRFRGLRTELASREYRSPLGLSPPAVVRHRHRSTLRQRAKQFHGYGRGYGFLQHLPVEMPVLSRYHVGYPASWNRAVSHAFVEATLLVQRVSSPDLRGLPLDRRVLYTAFDYVQRLAFLSGCSDISRKLKRADAAIERALRIRKHSS